MKKLFFLLVFFFATALSFAQSQVWVNGYTKSNGTYVSGYYRTAPDNTVDNNWTTIGNVNPHTFKAGTLPRSGTSSYVAPISTYNTTSVTPIQVYSTPIYSTPSTNYNSSNTVYTGPRGGTYYINSSGNKTYVGK